MSAPSREETSKEEGKDEEENRLLEEAWEGDEEVAYEAGEKILVADFEFDSVDDASVPPFSWKKLWLFTGPGFLMSIAFLDPGNLEGDLQAGAIAGYSLLWLLMWATFMGLLIQLLSARVGVATGRHLAELCREEYPNWARLVLWFMAELALIGADIQEVIGSAIAIQILSRGFFPLWAGVLITASDWYSFLINYGVRKLEAAFAVLIAVMALSFAWMFGDAKPNGKELLMGILVPRLSSKTIRQAVGVVGCVIMPHNVFLHSALVQSRKVDLHKKGRVQEALNYYSIESSAALSVSFMINLFVTTVFAKGFYETKQANSIGLVNAGRYLEEKYGGGIFPILYIWGIGLLAAGQSSTITGTYAGQFIMGGFLNLRLKKWLRALITRSFAIVPTIIVAIVFNRSEASLDVLNEWLNVLQSMQIPFALIPLLTLVSKERIMGTFRVGPILERVAWTVAGLIIVINGYLLLDFFISEVNGLLLGLLACSCTAAYVAFIIYLVSRSGVLPSAWVYRLPTGFSSTEN
ncbi:Metal transporter Nramp2 [Mucuna pruriens]|uniref:Metal transporter Nramp2 n=1 Tax=Mucuna pruriens TaxID=157652 RepID=A0A371E4B1_MUCPR|nr:Metal transporter Nramp2 [Mucuna pruriens]